MNAAAAPRSSGGTAIRPAAYRYWHFAGRTTRMVSVSIGTSRSNAARSRALTVRATRLGMPLDQQLWGRGMTMVDCIAQMKDLNAAADVFAVLLLPDAPSQIDVLELRKALQSYKDLIRPGAWNTPGPVRPGEVDCLLGSAIAAHRTHGLALSRCDAQSAR